jgi:hypothetical protein
LRKLIKLNVAVLACLLCVCVACSELCELTSWRDDVANDFTLQTGHSTHQAGYDISDARTALAPRLAAPRIDRFESAEFFSMFDATRVRPKTSFICCPFIVLTLHRYLEELYSFRYLSIRSTTH